MSEGVRCIDDVNSGADPVNNTVSNVTEDVSKSRSLVKDGEASSGKDRKKDDKDRRKEKKKSKSKVKVKEKSKKKKERKRKKEKRKKKRRRRDSSSSEDDSSSSSSSSSSSEDDNEEEGKRGSKRKRVEMSTDLMMKLAESNESLEARLNRKVREKNERIALQFGYTAEENPFNDPNLTSGFTWKKKVQKAAGIGPGGAKGAGAGNTGGKVVGNQTTQKVIEEIEGVRRRRQERADALLEMDRIKEEESRLREMGNFDEWRRKEEEFHLKQQEQRTAIRLVSGREKPVDTLGKGVLFFRSVELGEGNQDRGGREGYEDKNDAMRDVKYLDIELQPPYELLKTLKLNELNELKKDVREVIATIGEVSGISDAGGLFVSVSGLAEFQFDVSRYWGLISVMVDDEIDSLRHDSAKDEKVKEEIRKLFVGQRDADLQKMQEEVEKKLSGSQQTSGEDHDYWRKVLKRLKIHRCQMELDIIHKHMLRRQLDMLEERREELKKNGDAGEGSAQSGFDGHAEGSKRSDNNRSDDNDRDDDDDGDLADEIGLTHENIAQQKYAWDEKYRPRKPRYFNRVKTGYDWNTYNKCHYDHDNPPPKVVQGYKFNVFYPDLVDQTKTPQFFLEPADSPEFAIIRFHGGPPYEDIAFKILNKEWSRQRKKGFKCTFERGILSLFFNFNGHWYRR